MIVQPIVAEADAWQAIHVAGAPSRQTAGELIYAIGDVHGCYAPLRALLERIAVDASLRADGRRPMLVLLGDYVDRGPASAQVLEAVAWLCDEAPYEVHALAGNHERMLLDFLAEPLRAASWLDYGGVETLRSYGIEVPEGDDPGDPVSLRDALRGRLPARHVALLHGLDLSVEVGDYAFVHAGVRPHLPLARQSEQDLLWIRKGFLDTDAQHERMIVHGHSWSDDRPQLHANRFGIDTGVYATDVLTALRLDGMDAAFTQVRQVTA